jgi:hypothetical protein
MILLIPDIYTYYKGNCYPLIKICNGKNFIFAHFI